MFTEKDIEEKLMEFICGNFMVEPDEFEPRRIIGGSRDN